MQKVQGCNVAHVTHGPQEPTVGSLWWDKDHRVSSRYARVLEVLDDGRLRIGRGADGKGNVSTVRRDTLQRRFKPIAEYRA